MKKIKSKTELKEISFKMVNVVSSTKSDSFLDLSKISRHLRDTIYEPEIYPGLVHRNTWPKSTIISFASGKLTSTGANSIEQSWNSINDFVFNVEKIMEKEIKLEPIKIVNIVATSNYGKKINLDVLSLDNPNIKYSPREFPGAVCSFGTKAKILVFSTGKMVSVGGKNENDVKSSIVSAYQIIDKTINKA